LLLSLIHRAKSPRHIEGFLPFLFPFFSILRLIIILYLMEIDLPFFLNVFPFSLVVGSFEIRNVINLPPIPFTSPSSCVVSNLRRNEILPPGFHRISFFGLASLYPAAFDVKFHREAPLFCECPSFLLLPPRMTLPLPFCAGPPRPVSRLCPC